MTPKTTSEALEREAFEAAMAKEGYELNPVRYRDGAYRSTEYAAGWAMWQARAALHPPGDQPATAGAEPSDAQLIEAAQQSFSFYAAMQPILRNWPCELRQFINDLADSAKPAGEPRDEHAAFEAYVRRAFVDPDEALKRDSDGVYLDQRVDDEWTGWQARGALAAAPAPAEPAAPVPDGWKLVPVEPTKAMRRAGGEFWAKTSGHWSQVAGGAYRAMLAAAPVLKSEGAK